MSEGGKIRYLTVGSIRLWTHPNARRASVAAGNFGFDSDGWEDGVPDSNQTQSAATPVAATKGAG